MRRRARRILLASPVVALLAFTQASPAQAWVLVRALFVEAGAELPLVVEQTTAALSGRIGDSPAPAWGLTVGPTGPLLTGAVGVGAPCSRIHVAAWLDDRDGNGVLDAATGEALWVFVAATFGVDRPRSRIVALELQGSRARLAWSVDEAQLPALGSLAASPALVMLADGAGGSPRPVLVLGTGWPSDLAVDPRRERGELLALDTRTGRPWRAGGPAFEARLPGGVTAVDLDADGVHDRLYTTDAAARVWRIDLPSVSARGGAWRARLLADFSTELAPGQAFLFAPDVALLPDAGESGAFLAVTVGSSDRDEPSMRPHWLFQLRDAVTREATPFPLQAADLPLVEAARAEPQQGEPQYSLGFRRRLPGPLASAPLTVAGRLLVATLAQPASRCTVDIEREQEPVSVEVLSAASGVSPAGHPVVASVSAPIGAPLTADWSDDAGQPVDSLACRVGDTSLPHCPEARRLVRRWWLRKDAP